MIILRRKIKNYTSNQKQIVVLFQESRFLFSLSDIGVSNVSYMRDSRIINFRCILQGNMYITTHSRSEYMFIFVLDKWRRKKNSVEINEEV